MHQTSGCSHYKIYNLIRSERNERFVVTNNSQIISWHSLNVNNKPKEKLGFYFESSVFGCYVTSNISC